MLPVNWTWFSISDLEKFKVWNNWVFPPFPLVTSCKIQWTESSPLYWMFTGTSTVPWPFFLSFEWIGENTSHIMELTKFHVVWVGSNKKQVMQVHFISYSSFRFLIHNSSLALRFFCTSDQGGTRWRWLITNVKRELRWWRQLIMEFVLRVNIRLILWHPLNEKKASSGRFFDLCTLSRGVCTDTWRRPVASSSIFEVDPKNPLGIWSII